MHPETLRIPQFAPQRFLFPQTLQDPAEDAKMLPYKPQFLGFFLLYLFIAASTPSDRIISTASAASLIPSSTSLRSLSEKLTQHKTLPDPSLSVLAPTPTRIRINFYSSKAADDILDPVMSARTALFSGYEAAQAPDRYHRRSRSALSPDRS